MTAPGASDLSRLADARRTENLEEKAGQSAKSLSGEEVCPERGIDAGSEAFSA
jgi:hypothetical protein